MKEIQVWKKVFENDLDYIMAEMRDLIEKPAVVILSGPVGTGKTTFIKRFTKDNKIASPTYSIVNETKDCAHADFYRLKSRDELIHLELSLYMEGKEYFFIEWGRPYLSDIEKELGDEPHYYELVIEINDGPKKGDSASRNYHLLSL